ncbi:serine/threonine-protein kinase [Sphingomonas montanisoli]|uniref:Serine/threonine protein kinase n=1 Tax=Sphingomonas montanisoli TaxID=2606412 RepID=A0A5D9C818_9SPHN|nr:serine/threonine-protein kinase [Sphingomonas montanisoli]TZG27553.1 serine/threonine protein kinase [Sphingomonas montanisoli]
MNDDRPPENERTVFNAGPATPPRAPGHIQVDDVLNHIFRVTRFIARGGMGEVFEGINDQSDERVAIKVMLPALAADENVQAMFRKEARTLTRLSHPALVQYRVLAQEPTLGVLYIVTEFVDGTNLADVLTTLKPSPADVRALARRLADGLRVAHSLGAIHRDISPDNVLLEGGQLKAAKIIDFGIAKDLAPDSKTIVGDGFAGKLNYVAPEQLGDFGREVGPWSDIYSLGLVLLAVARGRELDMGATFVDAVDRRRAGVDLSDVSPELVPMLEPMLVADPAQRLRSMDAVLSVIDGARQQRRASDTATPMASYTTAQPFQQGEPTGAVASKSGGPNKAIIAAAAAGALLLAAVGGYYVIGGKGGTPAAVEAQSGKPDDQARAAVEGALPNIGCSWIDISDVSDRGGQVSVTLKGVALDTAGAKAAVEKALGDAGLKGVNVSYDNVLVGSQGICEPLDALRPIREAGSPHIFAPGSKFELAQTGGKLVVRVPVDIDIGTEGAGLAFYGIEPNGQFEKIANSRAELEAILHDPGAAITPLGGSSYRIPVDTDHEGLSGLLLLAGREPFDGSLVAAPPPMRGDDWRKHFVEEAQKKGWTANMLWYRTVDETPG